MVPNRGCILMNFVEIKHFNEKISYFNHIFARKVDFYLKRFVFDSKQLIEKILLHTLLIQIEKRMLHKMLRTKSACNVA